MNYKNLLVEINDGTAVITINRPDKLNALNKKTLEELDDLFSKLKFNDEVGVVILTGAGEKAFVAGADINELNQLNAKTGIEFAETGQSVFNKIENLGKPVVAAVNGFALGGGCELAMACHFRVASENAKFGQPEVNLGILPGYGGTQRLSRIIGTALATELILTGDMIDSSEAFRIKLVNHVYPQNELLTKAKEIADKINSKGRFAVQMSVKAITASDELSEKDGLLYEASLFGLCCGTDDFKEGTSAFLEKRKPIFTGK